MFTINEIKAREILDSRGNPTLEVDVQLENGTVGRAAVPSGASTGAHEAVELRDNDPKRFNGKGVSKAVQNVNSKLATELVGSSSKDQEYIDKKMIALDGTENKSNFGANAILGISLAVAKAAAICSNQPLFRYIGGEAARLLPVPMMNIINGGEHADNPIDIQEFMIMPIGASSFSQAMQWSTEIYANLKKLLQTKGLSTSVGDEGGFAPNLSSNTEAIELIITAIRNNNLVEGKDVGIALDCAASEFYDNGIYNLKGESKKLNSIEFTQYLEELTNKYPILSIEDGMDENDFKGWNHLTDVLGKKCQLVGDDLFVTNAF